MPNGLKLRVDHRFTKNHVHRRGYGRKPGRFFVFTWLSLAFWALIARIALREGRIVVVTGADGSGIETLLALLPGPYVAPPDEADAHVGMTIRDSVPYSGHFKVVNPRNLTDIEFRALLYRLAEDSRLFTLASNHEEWLTQEMRLYRREPGARAIFWLTLV